jgi:iron(II)-dependent oxidoreductase
LQCLEAAGALAERNETARRYLAAAQARPDRLLAAEIEERLAAWEQVDEDPAWAAARQAIEAHPFRDGVRDALHFTHDEQWVAWRELAAIEDDPEVDAYLRGLAPPGMVYIPPGTFLMGGGDDDPGAQDNEKPQHEVWLAGYYIDRYPVTNARYRAFIEAGGYETRAYWTEVGWEWKGDRRAPYFWDDETKNGPEQPVVGVSWYEAVAYARWAGKALPAEPQWEKAAGWDPEEKRMRLYPWGDEWDAAKRSTTSGSWPPVGEISPGRFNYYGVSDMAAIYVWCSSKFQSYPYACDDGREDLAGTGARVQRGGGYTDNDRDYRARCAFRNRSDPRFWDGYGGMRCVLPHACVSEF